MITNHPFDVVNNGFLIVIGYPIEPVGLRTKVKYDVGLLAPQLIEGMFSTFFEDCLDDLMRGVQGLPAHDQILN